MSTPELIAKRGSSAAVTAIVEFQTATGEVLAQRFPRTERATLLVVGLMLLAIMLFISFVKLDRIVSANGRLVPLGGTITVQPLETQVLTRVLVKTGDIVHKGDVLAVCDPTMTEADRLHLKDQVESLSAQLDRLTAEESGHAFSVDSGNPYDALQGRLYRQRQTELQAGLSDFDQRIGSTESQIAGLQKAIVELESRTRIGTEMEGMNNRLSKEGYVSRLALLGVQDQQIALKSQLQDARSNIDSSRHLLASLREQRKVFIEHWHSANLADIVTTRTSLEAARQDLTKASKLRDVVNLRAPADAIVTRTPPISTGGVAPGAVPLFALVPLNAQLEAAVQIQPADIGFVKVGDRVNLKFDAYKFVEHGVGHGVVTSISQDSFSDTAGPPVLGSGTGTSEPGGGTGSHFDARVRITDVNLKDLPDQLRMMPGMTVQADVIVGRRTILWYVLGGAMRSGAEAMHEP